MQAPIVRSIREGSLFTEIILLLIATYYNGLTVHVTITRGYYLIDHLKGPYVHDARIMYVGALLLVFLFYAITYLLLLLLDPAKHHHWIVLVAS